LEPMVLGLALAPSLAGGCLAMAVFAAFLARRPLRLVVGEGVGARRAAAKGPLVALAVVAAGFFAGAVALGGAAWLVWLAPVLAAGTVFLYFDLRAAGREELAEVTGAGAFALLPAVFAVLAGRSAATAIALAVIRVGRAVPAVLGIRASLRAAKTGLRRPAPALIGVLLALAAGALLARAGLAPTMAAVGLAILALRTVALLGWPRPPLRARTLGIMEAVLGAGFVLSVAMTWPA
jgi:hypothetical protein